MKSKSIQFFYLSFFLLFFSFNFDGLSANNAYYQNITYVSNNSSVNYACLDLQRYIGQSSGVVPVLKSFLEWEKTKEPTILICNLNYLQKYLSAGDNIAKLGNEGYAIKKVNINGHESILLASDTPLGQVNAIYGFLKEINFEFLLGSEYIPNELPATFSSKLIVRNPVFSVRGVLPWYNFFNSPTAWDPIDHRTFVDQLIRSGANFITFHSYEHEPFSAYKENGKMVYGNGLNNTSKPTWGTNPMETNEFLYGTNNFFDNKYFGAKSTLMGYDESTQIEKEKEIMRDALIYAKNRGLKVSMGFAAYGDPTNQKDREEFIKAFTYNIEYFKALDYIWLWQTETKGAQGFPLHYNKHILPDKRDPNSKIVNYGAYRRDVFTRIVDKKSGIEPFFRPDEDGKIARATEGARLEIFAKIALRILSRYNNAPKLVMAGWGGDDYLLAEEYYEGLDKLLPKDVVFSALDQMSPRKRVDKIYGELPKNRQRWPIPWLENDGDQWQPQTYLNQYESLVRDLKKTGSQGFLSIHWRTRDLDDNFGFLVNYATDTTLTKKLYFDNKAKKYGKYADSISNIYMDLDNLGYRWVGGSGQNECADFTWGSGSIENLGKLKAIKARLEALLPQMNTYKENLLWMNDRIQWVMNYQTAEIQAEIAKDYLIKAKESKENNVKKDFAKKAFGILSGNSLANAMQSYTQRISTIGEYGVLATINTKAGFDWRRMYKESCDLLGVSNSYQNNDWELKPQVIIPRLYGSSPQNENLEIKAIVTGGKSAILKYRSLGEEKWKQLTMKSTGGWVKTAIIPAADIIPPAIEFRIVIEGGLDIDFQSKVITINQYKEPESLLVAKTYSNQALNKIVIKAVKNMNVIEWNDLVNVDYYQVFINETLEVETPVNFYPLSKNNTINTIEIKAIKDGKEISKFNKTN